MSKSKKIEKNLLINKYIKQQLSAIEIANSCNCSSTTIYKYLELYSIKKRTIKEALLGNMFGDKNPNFKHGNKVRKYYNCIECGNPVTHGCFSGRCKSCAHKGKRAYNYKNGYTTYQHYCKDCKNEISNNAIRCEECNIKYQTGQNNPNFGNGDKIKGNRNPNWIDGRSHLDYPEEFNDTLKDSIRNRDNYICQNPECNMTEEEHLILHGSCLCIHHIDYNKKNCKEDNLITLCLKCNIKANYNRDYWQEIYSHKIKILISN
jgi:hypothetical protein